MTVKRYDPPLPIAARVLNQSDTRFVFDEYPRASLAYIGAHAFA